MGVRRWLALGIAVWGSGSAGCLTKDNPSWQQGEAGSDSGSGTRGESGTSSTASGSTSDGSASTTQAVGSDTETGTGTETGSTSAFPQLSFGDPIPLTELNSSTLDDDPTVRFDGREIYFASERNGDGEQIYRSIRASTDLPWPDVEQVADLFFEAGSSTPTLSADGLTITMASASGDDDGAIFFSTREDFLGPWSPPQTIPELDSAWPDGSTLLLDGSLVAYLCSGRNDGLDRIYRATRSDGGAFFEVPVPITIGLDAANYACDPWVDPTQTVLVFRNATPDGERDLYMARRPEGDPEGVFGAVDPIDAVNSIASETDPWLVLQPGEPRGWLFFTRGTDKDDNDLFVSEVTAEYG